MRQPTVVSRFLKNMKFSCGIKSTISDEDISNPYHDNGFESSPPRGPSRASRVKSEERKGSSSPSTPSGDKSPTGKQKPVSGAKDRSVSGANAKAGGKKPASGW